MKFPLSIGMSSACCILLLIVSDPAFAVTRYVVTDSSQCPADTVTTPCYGTVQSAVSAAADGDTVLIKPGTYVENIAVNNRSITLAGLETATTFLSGGGTDRVLTITASTAMDTTVRNLTFLSAVRGIVVQSSTSAVKIANNIFMVGAGSTAVQTQASPAVTIQNNLFYFNRAGIVSDINTLSIINNVFTQNSDGIAITPSTMSLASIQNNLFNGGTIGPPVVVNSTDLNDPNNKLNLANTDPLFVDPATDVTKKDFHLKSGSPCTNAGNASAGVDSVDGTAPDMGVYGGSFSDTIPRSVAILSSPATTSPPYDITVTWSANSAYTIKGYKVYYGYQPNTYNGNDALASGGTGTLNSPIDAGNAASYTLHGLSPSSVVPAAPTAFVPEPSNQTLTLTWSPVDNASSYTIYSGIASTAEIVIPGVTSPPYNLSGLTNGQVYMVQVAATFQAMYYLAVTAYDASGQSGGIPGSSHESNYAVVQPPVPVGPAREGGLSNVVYGIPQLINPYPDLQNTGCFIATAAYGSPSGFAVTVLREFRDRYLAASAPGRAFIRWYYANAPAAARFLNDHPAGKPIARIVLAPAVAVALLLIRTSPAAQTALVVLIALSLVVFRAHRKMRTCSPAKEADE